MLTTAYIAVTGLLFLLVLLGELTGALSDSDSRPTPRADRLAMVIRTTLVLWAILLLVGCGGGDCDADCQKDFEPVDCKARPELCV